MKTRTRIAGAVAAGLAALAVPAHGAPAAPAAGGTETYIVRPGDTLSGVAGRVLGDPKRWRELHAGNPQVTDPNRIYPGDALIVPGAPAAGAAGAEGAGAAGAKAGAAAEGAGRGVEAQEEADAAALAAIEPEPPVERLASIPVVNPALYHSAGYIADGLPQIAIVATADGKLANGTGDAVVINTEAECGSRYTVVRADRRIFHPASGEPLGWLVRVLGGAEISCTGKEASTAVLRGMRDAASVGDYLIPADPRDVLEENLLPPRAKAACLPPGPGDAMIVAFDEDRDIAGEQAIVYIDRGRASGVAPGKRFAIYREMEPGGPVMLGELQVLRSSERTATALVTTSLREIQVADLLRAR